MVLLFFLQKTYRISRTLIVNVLITNIHLSPHILLSSGAFEASESEMPNIANYVQQITHQVEPFTIELTKAKSFHPANNTIYLKVERTPEL